MQVPSFDTVPPLCSPPNAGMVCVTVLPQVHFPCLVPSSSQVAGVIVV